jgi:hypothetical protein
MFKKIKRQVRANFDTLAKESVLFYVNIDRDKIWELYLAGFPDEEERQGHDCNTCKSFLRQHSGVVAIIDNKRVSIWDNIAEIPDEFVGSIDNIKQYIRSRPITGIWKAEFKKCGVDKNTAQDEFKTVWDHFFFMAPSKHIFKKGGSIKSIEEFRGNFKTTRDMFKRAMSELSTGSIETTLELIGQNSLYRGAEFKPAVVAFQKAQVEYGNVVEADKENYLWVTAAKLPLGVTRFRNSAIGTLIINLSEMMDLNTAVAKYEAVVAPQNYKRTTALVTPAMIKAAKIKVEELGLMDSLERRHAKETDIDAENLLFIDKSSELDDAFGELSKEAAAAKGLTKQELDKVEEITVEKFIGDVLPHAKSVEVYLQNNHLNKFVSLITADNADAPTLFKWKNNFGWSYTGGITDSIKERVKAAGGQVVGELRISLSWYNTDDLDIHVVCPDGFKIYYGRKHHSPSNGTLDVDMNAGGRSSTTPVENIIFPNKHSMIEGIYEVRVNQYSRRNTTNVGYDVQIEHEGNITDVHYDKSPRNTDVICRITYSKTEGIKFDKVVDSKISVKEKWGLKTGGFVKVKQMMLSPNYWEDKTGNKHYMFMLEDCVSDEVAKPFFNEFLNSTFVENRKVFEVLADKFNVPKTDDQLSGLGFSETIPGEVTLRVEGKFKRLLKIKF